MSNKQTAEQWLKINIGNVSERAEITLETLLDNVESGRVCSVCAYELGGAKCTTTLQQWPVPCIKWVAK